MGFIRRKSAVFLLCISLSALFWFLNKLSKEYRTSVLFSVDYRLPPDNLILINTPPENLIVNLNAFGFDIMKIKFLNRKEISLNISDLILNSKNHSVEWSPGLNNDWILRKLPKDVSIISIIPEKINFNFEPRIEKKIPIEVDYIFEKTEEFEILKKPIITPDVVLVSGSAYELDTIKFWPTETINFEIKSKNFKKEINLIEPDKNSNLKLNVKKCIADFVVSHFTEKQIILPVSLLNIPFGYNAKIFPSKINARFYVTMDDFNDVTANNFTVVYDFKNKIPLSKAFITLTVVSSPENIKSLKISPQTVEYLLIKQ